MPTPVPHRSLAPSALLAALLALLALLMLLPLTSPAGPLDTLNHKIQLDLESHGDNGDGEQSDELSPEPAARVGNPGLAPLGVGNRSDTRATAYRYQPIRAPPHRG